MHPTWCAILPVQAECRSSNQGRVALHGAGLRALAASRRGEGPHRPVKVGTRRVQLVREGGTRRVQLVREGGTRRVQLVREGPYRPVEVGRRHLRQRGLRGLRAARGARGVGLRVRDARVGGLLRLPPRAQKLPRRARRQIRTADRTADQASWRGSLNVSFSLGADRRGKHAAAAASTGSGACAEEARTPAGGASGDQGAPDRATVARSRAPCAAEARVTGPRAQQQRRRAAGAGGCGRAGTRRVRLVRGEGRGVSD